MRGLVKLTGGSVVRRWRQAHRIVTAASVILTIPGLLAQAGTAGQGNPGRGGRGRGADDLVPTALLAERNLKPADFPTLRSTTGDVYVWQDLHPLGFLTNALIVVTSDGVLVADAQDTPEATKKMVDAIHMLTPQPIKYVIVCTDPAGDMRGYSAFPSTATFLSASITPSTNAQPAAATPGVRAIETNRPTLTVSDRRVLKMGSTEVQILNSGRSRTGRDLQVYLPQEKVLFTSDSFLSHIFPPLSEGYPTAWIQTVKKLQLVDATFVVPGHGFLDPVPNMTRELAEFEKALEYVVAEVTRVHATGASVDGALKQVNWGPYAGWSIMERNGPAAVRRIYDELDGRIDR
jgi:cyclase